MPSENFTISRFDGDYAFLSNFYDVNVDYNGITYKNTEAAFQAQKTTSIPKRLEFANFSASQSKKEGRKLALRNDWEEIKNFEMYSICKSKFLQNEDLKQKLIATGNAKLIEGNYWHDNYWGNCFCERCKNIEGKNTLGEILMKIRDALIKGGTV